MVRQPPSFVPPFRANHLLVLLSPPSPFACRPSHHLPTLPIDIFIAPSDESEPAPVAAPVKKTPAVVAAPKVAAAKAPRAENGRGAPRKFYQGDREVNSEGPTAGEESKEERGETALSQFSSASRVGVLGSDRAAGKASSGVLELTGSWGLAYESSS